MVIVFGVLLFHWRAELSILMAEPSAQWSRSVVLGEADNSRPPALVTLSGGGPGGKPVGGAVVAWGSDTSISWSWIDQRGKVRVSTRQPVEVPVHSLTLTVDETEDGDTEAIRAFWLDDIAGGALFTALLTLPGEPGEGATRTASPGGGVFSRKLADRVSAFSAVRDIQTGTARGSALVFSDGRYLYYSRGEQIRTASGEGRAGLARERGLELPNILSLDAVGLPDGRILVAVGSKPGYFTHEYHVLLREPSGKWRGPWRVAKETSGATVRPGRVHLAITGAHGAVVPDTGTPGFTMPGSGSGAPEGAGASGPEVLVFYDISATSEYGRLNKTVVYRGRLSEGSAQPDFAATRTLFSGPVRIGNRLASRISELVPGPLAKDGRVSALATADIARSIRDESREVVEVRLDEAEPRPVGAISARHGVALAPATAADANGARYATWLVTGGFGRYLVAAAGTGAEFRRNLGRSGAREWLEAGWNLLMRYGLSYLALLFAAGWLIPSFVLIVLGYVFALTWVERYPARLWFLGMLAYLVAKLYVLELYFYAPAFQWLMPEELGSTAGMLAAGIAVFAIACAGAWAGWRGGRMRSAMSGWWRVALVDTVLTALIWTPYLAR